MNQDSAFSRVEVFSKTESVSRGLDAVYPEALAVAVIRAGPNIATKVLKMMDVNVESIQEKLKDNLQKKVAKSNPHNNVDFNLIVLSEVTKKIIQIAVDCCKLMGDPVMGVQHLMLALLRSDAKTRNVFREHGVTFSRFREAIAEMVTVNPVQTQLPPQPQERERVAESKVGTHQPLSQKSRNKQEEQNDAEVLTRYCRDLSKLASEGRLDPVIGRDREMERILATLSRRKKNNPVLVGDPGVGKTSIIEGIAQRMASGDVSPTMVGKRLFALDLAAVVGRTQYRGQFEEKMRRIIDIFRNNRHFVLFVDEIHTLLGAGGSIGGLDAANIMKPALANGDIRCIGATTEDEYKKYFKKDGALERRFQRVFVDEPSAAETENILNGLRRMMEAHHGCEISPEAIKSSVEFTAKYVQDRRFPDKAIDCIDEACARFSYDKRNSKSGKIVIGRNEIANAISDQTGIDREIIIAGDWERVSAIELNLQRQVIGQRNAISAIIRVLKNAYSGVRNPLKPIGSFVFGGSSGTGKTFLAEKLAAVMFPADSSLIRINLAEFTEKHHVSRLVGSPPGYVGFGERNQLTDRVLRHPYSLILLDGLDAAHSEIVRLFSQILSDGMLTDSEGRDVSFRNSVLVMTMAFSLSGNSKLGFGDPASKSYEEDQRDLIAACKSKFDEEFVNRVDEFVLFRDLTNDELVGVARLMLVDLAKRLDGNGIDLMFDDQVVKAISAMRQNYHGLNAKPIERLIARDIETAISEEVMKNPNVKCSVCLEVSKDNAVVAKRLEAAVKIPAERAQHQ